MKVVCCVCGKTKVKDGIFVMTTDVATSSNSSTYCPQCAYLARIRLVCIPKMQIILKERFPEIAELSMSAWPFTLNIFGQEFNLQFIDQEQNNLTFKLGLFVLCRNIICYMFEPAGHSYYCAIARPQNMAHQVYNHIMKGPIVS